MAFSTNKIKGLILDMDGVIWKDATPIGDLGKIFAMIRAKGLKFVLATNNSTRSIDEYVNKMAQLGAEIYPHEILNSSLTVAKLLRAKIPEGSEIFTIGESGLSSALVDEGFIPVSKGEAKDPKAVVVGIDRKIDFEKVAEACLWIRAGIPFYATNPDLTFPTPRGLIPGNGAWISLYTTATGIDPIIAGKPSPDMLLVSMERMGTSLDETIMVGDRLETDILGGQRVGCATCLVLSGVTTANDAKTWVQPIDIITKDLESLVDLL